MLKAEVAGLKQLQEEDLNRVHREMASDRRRIAALESPPERDSPINHARAEKVRMYLRENGTIGTFFDKRARRNIQGKAVRFELLRSYLDIDKWQLNRTIRMLFKKYPGEYCRKKVNKTTWLLIELPKL